MQRVDVVAAESSATYARVPVSAARLRDLRLSNGWTQQALSMMVGVRGAAAVSAWERGLAVPRPATLLRIARAFGVEPVDLLQRDGFDVACHEHGTALSGFLPGSWDHLGCQSWDHPARLPGGSSDRSLDHLVSVVDVEVQRAWDSGRSA